VLNLIEDFKLNDDSILELIDNKDNIAVNHGRLKNHKALSILLGFEEGDYKKERNKNISEIINKIGKKK
jgi:hypothetical protein